MSSQKNKNKQKAKEPEPKEPKEQKELVYQVVTKRDESVLEAFITFNYRVIHPRVGVRFILYAVVFFTFAVAAGISGLGAVSFGIGALCVLFVLVRKYISLMMTKKDDKDFQNGTVYEYAFYEDGAAMFRDGKLEIPVKNYKKGVAAFFSDQNFYYLVVNDDDIFILPRNRFTKGEEKNFEEFISGKTGIGSRWIPSGMKGVIYRITNFLTKPIFDPSRRKDIDRKIKNEPVEKEEAAGEVREAPKKPKTLKKREDPASGNASGNDEV